MRLYVAFIDDHCPVVRIYGDRKGPVDLPLRRDLVGGNDCGYEWGEGQDLRCLTAASILASATGDDLCAVNRAEQFAAAVVRTWAREGGHILSEEIYAWLRQIDPDGPIYSETCIIV